MQKEIKKFSSKTAFSLNYYVYILTNIDPITKEEKIFYVGRGKGNRVFSHINLKSHNDDVNNMISKIDNNDFNPYFIRWNLSKENSKIVESVIIDLLKSGLTLSELTLLNKKRGSDSQTLTLIDEFDDQVTAPIINIHELSKKHNLNVLVVKNSWNKYKGYYDFRANAEGFFNLQPNRVNKLDIILLVHSENHVYAAYEYVKDSVQVVNKNWLENEYRSWLKTHVKYGRNQWFVDGDEKLYFEEDENGNKKIKMENIEKKTYVSWKLKPILFSKAFLRNQRKFTPPQDWSNNEKYIKFAKEVCGNNIEKTDPRTRKFYANKNKYK